MWMGLIICVVYAIEPAMYFGDDNKVYTDWLDSVSYQRNTFIPSLNNPNEGIAMLWTLNDTHIELAVAAKANGWAGFGIGDAGGMLGSDIVTFSAEEGTLTDSYVLDTAEKPFPDISQDWSLKNSIVDNGFIIFEASRQLNTGDSQDRPILDDSDVSTPPARIIGAWGDGALSFHGENRVRSSVRLYANTNENVLDSFRKRMAAESENTFDFLAGNYTIPKRETEYKRFYLDLYSMNIPTDKTAHIIGIEPLIDPTCEKYVHHFVLTAFGTGDRIGEVIFAWAPGTLPLELPPNVGISVGDDFYTRFRLEIHYDNPGKIAGNVDNSGVRFHWTLNKREYDLGFIQLGDPLVALSGEKVKATDSNFSQWVFECPSSCSTLFLDEPVNVITESLHLHQSGISMLNEQIREGKVVRSGKIEYYEFDAQGSFEVPQPQFQILPGDSFRTTCNYNPAKEEVFGLASSDEMCIAFLAYYPRKIASVGNWNFSFSCYQHNEKIPWEFPECQNVNQNPFPIALQNAFEANRTFGLAPKVKNTGSESGKFKMIVTICIQLLLLLWL